ncbi:MAG: RnfABCDGE type electron transport complex subunit D, partial [Anaerolineaceae bacterium]|nr:RnfABCDGE type electron transport complex subunit D [Anaerolineaceae bacterium]
HQLVLMGVTVAAANAAEAATLVLRKRKINLNDGSATVTGLLLALTLPPDFPLLLACIGAVVAIGLGKQIFGGLGYNIFNPALVGRAFLAASFPSAMTAWKLPSYAIDSITTATPLAASKFEGILAPVLPSFLGNIGGTLGETSSLAILAGGILLVALGIANWRIPLSMILGMTALSTVGWLINPAANPSPLFHLFTGGFMFAAFFMATDWVTSPFSARGKWVFGFGITLLVMIIRWFGGLAEGVMFAVLLMNAFVPMINRYTTPRLFGVTA